MPVNRRQDGCALLGRLQLFAQALELELTNHHNHLALAAAVEFAEKNSLPAPQQQLPICKRDGDAGSDEAGFDMRVGILFVMTKSHPVLWNQEPEQLQHLARHIRIRIL